MCALDIQTNTVDTREISPVARQDAPRQQCLQSGVAVSCRGTWTESLKLLTYHTVVAVV
jgi:hypothetical protein